MSSSKSKIYCDVHVKLTLVYEEFSKHFFQLFPLSFTELNNALNKHGPHIILTLGANSSERISSRKSPKEENKIAIMKRQIPK